jgi:hypothetical protein
VDQLIASWEEFAREGGCPGGKTHQIFSTFSLFLSVFVRTVDAAPDFLNFPGKLVIPSFLKFRTCEEASLGSSDMVSRTEATGGFFARQRVVFRLRFWLDRGNTWRSESFTPCLNMSSSLKFRTCGSNRNKSKRI